MNDSAHPDSTNIVWIGIPSLSSRLHELLSRSSTVLPLKPESYTVRRLAVEGKTTLIVAGADDRGLMYGLLELVRQAEHSAATDVAGLMKGFREQTERADVSLRGMIQFVDSADLNREWFYDHRYWEAYLGMLARNRFNSFNLVFGHNNAYFAPPYPFFFSLDAYPQVRAIGATQSDQKRNLDAVRMISRMAREHGIEFVMGIWQHRSIRGQPAFEWQRQNDMVEGLTDELLVDYVRSAVEQLLRLVPDISGIQLRVNSESGIERELQSKVYGGVFAGMKAAGRPVFLDLRAWACPQALIEAAGQSGLPMRLSVKHWAEFMGMPYQAAEMIPRYSYGDFLQYPRRYPILYQVWSVGSHRVLPWGSVDWVKRFASSTHLGEGLGFETCAPLS